MTSIDEVYTLIPNIGQNRSEIEALYSFLEKEKPKNVLEIGTQFGGTFYLWCKLATGKKISIDLVGGDYGGVGKLEVDERNVNFRAKWFPNDNTINFVEGNSNDPAILKQALDILNGEPIDFLFIDGDHSYEGVKRDFEIYSQFVKKGGYVAFHDVNIIKNCGVDKFWNELEGEKIEFNDHTSWVGGPPMGGIGVLKIV